MTERPVGEALEDHPERRPAIGQACRPIRDGHLVAERPEVPEAGGAEGHAELAGDLEPGDRRRRRERQEYEAGGRRQSEGDEQGRDDHGDDRCNGCGPSPALDLGRPDIAGAGPIGVVGVEIVLEHGPHCPSVGGNGPAGAPVALRGCLSIRTLASMWILRRATMLALLLAATLPSLVLAHATLLGATPAPGARLTTLPSTILLTFDDVLTSESSFVVLGSAGLTFATGALDPTDSKSLTAPMPALADGTYDVRWSAISADDGFLERDSFQFTVALATPGPSGPATPPDSNDTGLATARPSAIPSTQTSGSEGSADAWIPILVVAALIAMGLAWFLRRRTAT